MSAHVLAFPPRPAPAAPPEPERPPVAHYSCVREVGAWRGGIWDVERSDPCGHRHRTIAAARDCLPRWPMGPPDRWGLRAKSAHSDTGQILAHAADGSTWLAQHLRPARYRDDRAECHGLVVTIRRWWDKGSYPRPGYPVEITIERGAFTVSFCGGEGFRGRAADFAGVLAALLVGGEPDRLVAMHVAMHAPESLPDGVTRIR